MGSSLCRVEQVGVHPVFSLLSRGWKHILFRTCQLAVTHLFSMGFLKRWREGLPSSLQSLLLPPAAEDSYCSNLQAFKTPLDPALRIFFINGFCHRPMTAPSVVRVPAESSSSETWLPTTWLSPTSDTSNTGFFLSTPGSWGPQMSPLLSSALRVVAASSSYDDVQAFFLLF